MDIYEAISTRKSVRKFQERDVPEALLRRLLNAARLAPSARNRQEWRFVVVRDPATRAKLAAAANNQHFVGEAPVVLACCAGDTEHLMSCGQPCYPIDVAIAMDHLSLCATAEGLGTCWIGAFDEAQVKAILGVPVDVPLGYPKDPSPVSKNRLPLETIVMKDRWAPDR